MSDSERTEELLEFFKALADASRLKIIGVLAQQPSTVAQLAVMLDLQPSTVSKHLSYLAHVGLVSAGPRATTTSTVSRRLRWRRWRGGCWRARRSPRPRPM